MSSLLATLSLAVVGGDQLGLAGKALSALGLWIGLVGAAKLASRRRGSGSMRRDFGVRMRPVDIPLGVGAALLTQFALVPLVALVLRPLLGRPVVEGPARDLVGSAHGLALVVLVAMVVVGAPAVEELFYRGLFLRAVQSRFGSIWGVTATAVFFGLSHQNRLPVQGALLVMISLAGLGAVLAILAVRTGRLGASMIAHATFNAVTVVLVLAR